MTWVGVAVGDGLGEGVAVVVGCGVKEAVGEAVNPIEIIDVGVHNEAWVEPPCHVRLKA